MYRVALFFNHLSTNLRSTCTVGMSQYLNTLKLLAPLNQHQLEVAVTALLQMKLVLYCAALKHQFLSQLMVIEVWQTNKSIWSSSTKTYILIFDQEPKGRRWKWFPTITQLPVGNISLCGNTSRNSRWNGPGKLTQIYWSELGGSSWKQCLW